jgi:hypothetical protein
MKRQTLFSVRPEEAVDLVEKLSQQGELALEINGKLEPLTFEVMRHRRKPICIYAWVGEE